MSILSDFEDRVSRAVEGVFAGVFRSPVQPAELARAAAKEMDRGKKLGVGKVYAPTLYSVLLSPADAEQLGGFADTLAGELETYLLAHAREKRYELATRPRVRFVVDDELRLGRFEIIGELLSPEEILAELGADESFETFDPEQPPASADAPGPLDDIDEADRLAALAAGESGFLFASPLVNAEDAFAGAAALAAAAADSTNDEFSPVADGAPLATVTVPGVAHDVALTGERVVVGRLKACDICLADTNASRQHIALEREGVGWVVVDLGSTNGTLVNGERITRARLIDGDVITVGVSELIYHEPRG